MITVTDRLRRPCQYIIESKLNQDKLREGAQNKFNLSTTFSAEFKFFEHIDSNLSLSSAGTVSLRLSLVSDVMIPSKAANLLK